MYKSVKISLLSLLCLILPYAVYLVKISTSSDESLEISNSMVQTETNYKNLEDFQEKKLEASVGESIRAKIYFVEQIHNEILEIKKLVDNLTLFPEIEVAKPTSSEKKPFACIDKDDASGIIQHGKYWLLRNYVKASKKVKCHESITYTTHCEFRFLDNVIPLLESWQAPISVALWAPGDYFNHTLDAIAFYRKCHPKNSLVQQFATFHIFFETDFIPKVIPQDFESFVQSYVCPANGVLANVTQERYNLTYPVNVGRNLARDAALTHYVLASDIELYPSRGVVDAFFKMLEKSPELKQKKNQVFVLPIFEVDEGLKVPENKTKLISLYQQKLAVRFHSKICWNCHRTPQADEWIKSDDGSEMKIFVSAKREREFFVWEPIYIGTNFDPLYDERLSWDGKSDKMTQAYIMCVLDYDFHVLSNAFLVHKPGIKVLETNPEREKLVGTSNKLLYGKIYPEVRILYKTRSSCDRK